MTVKRIASILLLIACGVFFASAARAGALEDQLLLEAIKQGAPDDGVVVLLARAPQGADAEALSITKIDYDPASGRFIAALSLESGRSFTLQGRIEPGIEVPVLNRAVIAGEIIVNDDVEFLRLPASRVTRGALTAAEDIIGNAAKRALRPGTLLRTGDVARPIVVKKGDFVTVVFTAPGIELSTRGRAMTDGAMGEAISVQNSQSSRQIEAVVQGPGFVSVSPGRILQTAAYQ